jgi:hypothetical protein
MAGKSKRDSLFKYHSFLFDTEYKVCIAGTARLLAGKMRWLTHLDDLSLPSHRPEGNYAPFQKL